MKETTAKGARAPKKTTDPMAAGRTIDESTRHELARLADTVVVALYALRGRDPNEDLDTTIAGSLERVIDGVASDLLDVIAEADRAAKGRA